MLRYKTKLETWFSHLVRHLARKRSGSILTTQEPVEIIFVSSMQTSKLWQHCCCFGMCLLSHGITIAVNYQFTLSWEWENSNSNDIHLSDLARSICICGQLCFQSVNLQLACASRDETWNLNQSICKLPTYRLVYSWTIYFGRAVFSDLVFYPLQDFSCGTYLWLSLMDWTMVWYSRV